MRPLTSDKVNIDEVSRDNFSEDSILKFTILHAISSLTFHQLGAYRVSWQPWPNFNER